MAGEMMMAGDSTTGVGSATTSGAATGAAMGPWGAVAGAAIGAGVGLYTANKAGKANKAALAQMQGNIDQAIRDIESAGLPPDISGPLLLEKFKALGIYSPELEQQINITSSKLADLSERDPSVRQAQEQSLRLLQQSARTGLRPEDRMVLNQQRQQVASDVNAKMQQIMQNYQARNQGGSGSELVAMLQAGQSGADRASSEGDRVAAQASMNALSAINQGGQLAGSLRQQDWNTDSSKATAQDALNQFNTANSLSVQRANIAAKNKALSDQNIYEKSVAQANTEMGNDELRRQNTDKRQFWLDKLNRGSMLANARTGNASNIYNATTAQNNAKYGAISSAIGGLASAGGQYMVDQDKENRADAREQKAIDAGKYKV